MFQTLTDIRARLDWPSAYGHQGPGLTYEGVTMKLRLSEIASVAEIVGAIAIVISLIYVGIEVKDSTRAVRSATANESIAAMSAWYLNVGSSEQASQMFFKGMTNPESLTREEKTQYIFLSHAPLSTI